VLGLICLVDDVDHHGPRHNGGRRTVVDEGVGPVRGLYFDHFGRRILNSELLHSHVVVERADEMRKRNAANRADNRVNAQETDQFESVSPMSTSRASPPNLKYHTDILGIEPGKLKSLGCRRKKARRLRDGQLCRNLRKEPHSNLSVERRGEKMPA